MQRLVFANGPTYRPQNRIVTVGTDPRHDCVVESNGARGLLFTLKTGAAGREVLPADARLKLNGKPVRGTAPLQPCDRLEWEGGACVYLADAELPAGDEAAALGSRALDYLHHLATQLGSPGGIAAGLHRTLAALVEMSGAEAGLLLTEKPDGSSWQLSASVAAPAESGAAPLSRHELFSNTILQEAVASRRPVHVESIVGHPWSSAASVIEAHIFSVACLPLAIGGHVHGAAFIYTCSPGRSISKASLETIFLFASQAALLLASRAEIAQLRAPETPRTEPSPSPAMQELHRKIDKLAPTPLSLLLQGETGSGKEVAARRIHERSDRAAGPFVAINCAAIPSALIESLLFGHERGAFTGADRAQEGRFRAAEGGTLFLDEIGDLPLELQAKLLRVLQEKVVEPVGARAGVPVDVRVIAASHRDLGALASAGRFREDLLFRLAGATLRVPPLRERGEGEILGLARFFLARTGQALRFSETAAHALATHPWPGNVRELEQVVGRAAFLAEGAEIQARDLELDARPVVSPAAPAAFSTPALPLEKAQLAFTADYVRQALGRRGGNRSLTATDLGISERTLYRLLADRTDGADRTGRSS